MGRATEKFADIDDLPEDEVSGYSRSQRAAFKNAWNRCVDKGKDRSAALAEAHTQARQAANGSN